MRTVFVSIMDSSTVHFRRALQRGNMTVIRAAAAELAQIGLADALAICWS
jgi:hypothetical protein